MRIFAVILAGGAGARFGGADKALLTLNGERLIDLVLARIHPQVEAVAISANGDPKRFGPKVHAKMPVLPDATPVGPLSGLLTAMDWAGPLGADYVATVAVDTPHFPCDLIARLCLALDTQPNAKIALAKGARVHGTFGLWPLVIRNDLAAFLASGANPKVLDFATRHPVAYAPFAHEAAFDNINTPQDLARINAQLQR